MCGIVLQTFIHVCTSVIRFNTSDSVLLIVIYEQSNALAGLSNRGQYVTREVVDMVVETRSSLVGSQNAFEGFDVVPLVRLHQVRHGQHLRVIFVWLGLLGIKGVD